MLKGKVKKKLIMFQNLKLVSSFYLSIYLFTSSYKC